MRGHGKEVENPVPRSHLLAQSDDELVELLRRPTFGIGLEEFLEDLRQRHARLIGTSVRREDVALRRRIERISADLILKRVCEHYKITLEQLQAQRKNDWIRPIAAWLLVRLGGLSQRQVAQTLGVQTGAAVCVQLKRLRESSSRQRNQELKRLLATFPEDHPLQSAWPNDTKFNF